MNAGEYRRSTEEICNSVSFFCVEFDKLQTTAASLTIRCRETWKVPPECFYKVNCDGSYYENFGSGGWGFVIRNEQG